MASVKTVSVVIAVVAACLAMAAPVVAQEFHIEKQGYLTAVAPATFENDSNETEIKCSEVAYQGTMATTDLEQVQINAAFYKCWIGLQHVEVLMNGCYFLWKAPAEAGKVGSLQIACPGSQRMELRASICTAKAAPQTVGSGVTYSNFGKESSRDFVAAINAAEIDYEIAPATCSATFGSGNDGRLTSSPTVQGFWGSFLGTWVS